MNIKNLYPTSVAPPRMETSSATREHSPSIERDRPRLRIVRDRVVISSGAREMLDEMRKMPNVDMSIKSLLGAAPLTHERADQVLERIHHGYYNQPGVLKEVASVLSTALESDP